ncbi:hypothetical protein [Coxiella burnetii]|uniref:hypothetical protein n=1 Tax=Coxiella burnetii TaxID=777 RepID=UPI0003A5D579|nr:hypothetical protein [Coxiella burnetii]
MANFVSAMQLKYGDVELSLDIEPESHLLTADLEESLSQLFQAVGVVAKEKKRLLSCFLMSCRCWIPNHWLH